MLRGIRTERRTRVHDEEQPRNDPQSWILRKEGLWTFRGVFGVSALIAGVVLLATGGDRPLGLSFLVLGLFILFHLLISWRWDVVTTPLTVLTLDRSGMYSATTALLAAPGVIVVLVGAFVKSIPLAAKWGMVSLGLSLLVGLVLFGLLVTEVPQPTPRRRAPSGAFFLVEQTSEQTEDRIQHRIQIESDDQIQDQILDKMNCFMSYFTNATLWLLAFGIVSITFALVLPSS